LDGINGGLLRNGTGTGSHLALDLVAGLGNRFGRGQITDPPAGHGIAFGAAVDNGGTLFQVAELGDAFVAAHKIDVFVDFVRHDEHVRVPFEYGGQGSQFIPAVNTS